MNDDERPRFLYEATVTVNVSLARHGVREAIDVAWASAHHGYLNPGQARRLADDLSAAADMADSLCPHRMLTAVNG